MGAVISDAFSDGSEHPIAYASRMLTASEKNYAQLEKEALTLLFGVHQFHQYLYSRRFTLITGHKPFLSILGPKKGVPSLAAAHLQRWALILTAYNYQIEFKTTSAHSNADGLSRLPLPSPSLTSDSSYIVAPPQNGSLPDVDIFVIGQLEALLVTSKQLKVATRCDPILSRVFRYKQQGCPSKVSDVFKPYWMCDVGSSDYCSQETRGDILQELHQGHPGIVRMKSIAHSHVWWPKLDHDIESLSKSCEACQSVRSAPLVAPCHPWVWPARPWQRVHLPNCCRCPFQVAEGHADEKYHLLRHNTRAPSTVLFLWLARTVDF